jgi:hypothetical protein
MECIERWRNLDLRKLSDNGIDKELSDFLENLGHYPVSTAQTTPFKLWRLRKFKYLFKIFGNHQRIKPLLDDVMPLVFQFFILRKTLKRHLKS